MWYRTKYKGGATLNELLIDRLKTARISNGLKQQDVAEQMGIKANTISNWEKGRTEPDIDSFVKLCDIYKIDCASLLSDVYAFERIGTDISLSEYDYIKKYRALDNTGRQHVDTIIAWETERVFHQTIRIENEKREDEVPVYILNYYQRLASAGSGEYLFDNIPTDTIEVPTTSISEQADFVIGVNGRSMEPTYYDGDKVYVKITDEIPIGCIGLFTRGNECFLKELGINCLKSHNEEYTDIPASNDIRLVGEVLGKVEED